MPSILSKTQTNWARKDNSIYFLFVTILLIRGKVNFRNMSRYSDQAEKTYARQFDRSFDFADFNERLIAEIVPGQHKKIGAMDCSYIAKSGRKTYGLGFFYDSSHDQPAKGLEISNLEGFFHLRP